MNTKIVTRAEALRQGLKRYFTGKPCKHGHITFRHCPSGICFDCRKNEAKKYQSRNLDKFRVSGKAHYDANREHILARRRQRYNREREHILALNDQWRLANLENARARTAKHRAAKLQRTPPWADLEAIKAFYEACPKGYHVDHHYPLQGKICSGLHVIENLRYLPASVNCSKGNSMPQEFFRKVEVSDCYGDTA